LTAKLSGDQQGSLTLSRFFAFSQLRKRESTQLQSETTSREQGKGGHYAA